MVTSYDGLENTSEHFVCPWYVRDLNKWIFSYAKRFARSQLIVIRTLLSPKFKHSLKCLVLKLRLIGIKGSAEIECFKDHNGFHPTYCAPLLRTITSFLSTSPIISTFASYSQINGILNPDWIFIPFIFTSGTFSWFLIHYFDKRTWKIK